MWFLGFKPRARNHEKKLQQAPFLVALARKITMYLTMKWPSVSSYCGGYFYR